MPLWAKCCLWAVAAGFAGRIVILLACAAWRAIWDRFMGYRGDRAA